MLTGLQWPQTDAKDKYECWWVVTDGCGEQMEIWICSWVATKDYKKANVRIGLLMKGPHTAAKYQSKQVATDLSRTFTKWGQNFKRAAILFAEGRLLWKSDHISKAPLSIYILSFMTIYKVVWELPSPQKNHIFPLGGQISPEQKKWYF